MGEGLPVLGSVLVVDDDPDDILIASRVMEGSGRVSRVEISMRPAEALQLIRAGEFDLVLLDINMPGQSGFDVLDALEGEPSSVRVVLLTSSEDAADRAAAARRPHVADYLVKPLTRRAVGYLADRFGRAPDPGA